MPERSTPRPSSLRLRGRYWRVLRLFFRILLSIAYWDILLRRIGLASLARRTAPSRYRRAAVRFRVLASDLGGLWIKVGQFLSARVDVLPEAVTSELAQLQDEVNPETLETMQQMVEAELGMPITSAYAWFDPAPLASASLGQVHRARLPDGAAVVVKVQRPGIHDLIDIDLRALRTVVGWLKRYRAIARRADLDALLAEFSRTLWDEVDYLKEAENARRFATMFAEDETVRIPRVYESQSTRRVLTLEDVYNIKITDYASIEAAGIDRAAVADRLFRTYLRQIFVEGFFHADPHPGNLFVQPTDGDWRLTFVDFGMVGRLTAEAKGGLRELAIGIGTRDPDRLIRAYQQLGMLLPGADLDRIRQAEKAVLAQIWGKSMRDLVRAHPAQMREFTREFRDLIYEMPFQVPSDLLFLGRCLGILSGMCTGLDPDFNLFQGLAPFARSLLEEEGRPGWETALDWLLEQAQLLASLPRRIDATLSRIERGELEVRASASSELEAQLRSLTWAVERLVGAVIFGVLVMVSVLLYGAGRPGVSGGVLALALVLLLAYLRPRRL
jgi:predicted unusual protein kinase regulating ubiquinone biosynthesis (AarF/ABC1/UbiB family)